MPRGHEGSYRSGRGRTSIDVRDEETLIDWHNRTLSGQQGERCLVVKVGGSPRSRGCLAPLYRYDEASGTASGCGVLANHADKSALRP